MSAKLQLYDTFFPVFGVGLPDNTVPKDRPYYDISANPYLAYIYHNGWQEYSAASPLNAISLQGVSIAATAPLDGQTLKYNGVDYAPS